MRELSQLFRPISIGSLEVKNRTAMPAMFTNFINRDGTISQRLIDYLVERAKGGVGLITTEVCTVDEMTPYIGKTIGLWDARFIPGIRELTDAIHAHGARIVPQVAHPGPESLRPFIHRLPNIGPSPVMSGYTKQICREASIDEIETIIEQFADAALCAREGGFDGIELHAAHSYMFLGSFLSPLRNKRTDDYGGSLEGRLQLPIAVLQRIRERVGDDFPIIMRISGDYIVEGGIDIRESQYMAPILVEAGVDAFHVSAGVIPELAHRIIPPTGSPKSINSGLSAAIKQVVDVPVMTVGRINDPFVAEDVLKRGDADMVMMGRALLADPEFVNKAHEGRFDEIIPCFGCGIGCIGVRSQGLDMTCVVNPDCGKESESVIEPAKHPKKVMVVGAGLAGMEAALTAARRGHHVTIFESNDRTGGQFNLAAMPPHKQELTLVTQSWTRQLQREGVSLRLDTVVTEALTSEFAPDVAIVATGSEPIVPDMPGIDGPNVCTASAVLAGEIPILPGHVLIIGGGLTGCETAEFMYRLGDNQLIGDTAITIVEMGDRVALDAPQENRAALMGRMREKGIEILTNTKVMAIADDVVVIECDGKEDELRGFGRIVIAVGAKPLDSLSEKLGSRVAEVITVGDAKSPRTSLEAIHEGREAALSI